MKPDFYLRRGDRLAARLRHILYAWRFTRKTGAKLYVWWLPRDRSVAAALAAERYEASLVWDIAAIEAKHGAEIAFQDHGPAAGRSVSDLAGPPFDAMRPHAFAPDFLDHVEGREVTFLSNQFAYRYVGETKQQVFEELRALHRELTLQPALQGQIDRALDTIGGSYRALHVRRGDIPAVLQASTRDLAAGLVKPMALKYAHHAAKQTAPLRFYHSYIEEALAQGMRIVFFSDTPTLYEPFAERYGPDRILDGAQLGGTLRYPLEKAALDFTLLSRATGVIGTQTGFASFAALLGGTSLLNASARGSIDEFRRFFFEELLLGAEMPEAAQERLMETMRPEYEKYRAQAERSGVALDLGGA